MHQYTLSGLNIGSGADFEISGEKYVLEYIKNSLQSSGSTTPVIFDVGANIGDYSQAINTVFAGKSQIYAFEPARETCGLLKRNCAGIANLSVNQIALGETEGSLTMYSDKAGSALASVNKRRLDHFNIAFNNVETITVTTLDVYCTAKAITNIDFLKLDVEGHELAVLRGAKRMLDKKAIKFIQFEFGGANIDSRTFFQDFYYLLKDNYSLYRILSDGLQEITEYNEQYEIFLASNFLAIKK